MKIISVDPGYGRCGIAVIEKNKQNKKEILLFSGCIETSVDMDFYDRIFYTCAQIDNTIKQYGPKALAIEKLFFNTNQKTASAISEVRGAIIYLAKKANLSIYEYTPIEIKVATTGYGRSTKQQVISMIPKLIETTKTVRLDDEWDAIAVGLTCFAHEKFSPE